jgi:hypothetical protein
MEKLSLQSANLNGIKVLMTTTRNELKKLNIPNSRLFTNDRGYGAIYYSEVTKNTYIGCCTVEPPDLIMATKEEIPDFIKDHIFSCATEDVLSMHDVRLKRRLNRLDIEWEVEKEFDESEQLKNFMNATKNKPQFVLRRMSTAADKFADKYGINIKTTHFDADGKMAIDYYDFNNRYVVSYDVFGITDDGRLQLYYVRWYDKPSLQYVEDHFENDPNIVKLGAIEFII